MRQKIGSAINLSFEKFSAVSCLVAFAISAIVLIGWQFDIAMFKSILPNYITMKANTAVGIIGLTVALWCLRKTSCSRLQRIMGTLSIGLTCAIGIFTLAEYLTDSNFNIDEFLYLDPAGHTGKFPPGRLAPVTCIIFLMIGSGAFLMDMPKKILTRLSNIFFFTAFVCSFQAFVGYFCGVTYTFGSAFYTQIAIHTALACSLLALGFLAARPQNGFMALIAKDNVVGSMARKLVAAAVLFPPVIEYIQLFGHRLNLYDADFGVLVRVIFNVIFFVVIAWRMSAALQESDLDRIESITRTKELEDILQAKELARELNAAMSHALSGIAKINAEGEFLTVNNAFASILERDSTDLIGKSWLSIAHIDSQLSLSDMSRVMLLDGRAEAEIRGVDVGSEARYLHVVLVRVETESASSGSAYLFATDISERKLSEAALHASQHELSEAQAIAQLGSWWVDPHSSFVVASEEFYRIYGLGFKEKAVKREVFQRFIHPDDREETLKKIAISNSTQEPYRLDYRIVRPNGDVRHIHCRGQALFDSSGKATKYLGTVQDVTDLRSVELELIATRETALEGSRLKSEFLANMSHEIRTPINGVIGMSELLFDTSLTPEQIEFVSAIRRSADTLLVLINDILDVSKIEAGKLDIEIVEFDLDEIVSDVGKAMSLHAKTKDIDFNIKSLASVEHLFKGDPGRIRQVLMNLISNAIKFTSEGFVQLHIETEDERIRFTIKDTGVGIPAPTLLKLFQPFTQADSSTTRRFGGTGLGLSICKQLVELMGGSIGVTSEMGSGSTFWFNLPLPLGSLRQIPVLSKANSVLSPELQGARILVAEDNIVNQKVAQGLLLKLGCRPHCVGNGLEAINALKDFSFDLVLMDCQMPELDGYSATAKIREMNAAFSHIPIVAMTANALKGDRERCLAAGMNDYISKPTKMPELRTVLLKWIGLKDTKKMDNAV